MPSSLEPRVVLYGTQSCGFCVRARLLLDGKQIVYTYADVSGQPEKRRWLINATGRSTVPQIFIDGKPIGGYTDLAALDRLGMLDALRATAA